MSRKALFQLLAASVSLACTQTPIDAIVADSEPPPSTEDCNVGVTQVTGAKIRLRAEASQRCLAVGDVSSVFGNPAYLTKMVDDCVNDAEVWQPTLVTGGNFELRSQSVNYNLDMEMASMNDGTRAILYAPQPFNLNQRFFLIPRAPRVFLIEPAHVQMKCITERSPTPVMEPCDPTATDQSWEILPANCD